jgi:hypothetical protein
MVTTQSLSGWDVVIIALGVFHCVALAYVIIAALMIKNGTVARLIARTKPMIAKGQDLATQGKHLAMVGKEHGPQIAAHLTAIKGRATIPPPTGLTIEYAHLQKALSVWKMAAGGLAGLGLLTSKKAKQAKKFKGNAPSPIVRKKQAKPLLVERLGLIPPIARPLMRAMPTMKKILPVVIQTIKAQKK